MNTIKRIKDPKVAAEIVEKALNLIVDNPKNLSIIKNANKDYIRNFIQNVVTGKITEYFLIGFMITMMRKMKSLQEPVY